MVGIYVIKSDNHFYIGLSSNLNKRKDSHFYLLKNNKHPNPRLQGIFNLGIKLEFEVIQECKIKDLNRLEILWMELYQLMFPNKKILNLKSGGNRPEFTFEAKERISKSKSKKEYDYEKRYVVHKFEDDELLFVGTILEISKYLKITSDKVLTITKSWNDTLNTFINITEELDDDFLDVFNDENYF